MTLSTPAGTLHACGTRMVASASGLPKPQLRVLVMDALDQVLGTHVVLPSVTRVLRPSELLKLGRPLEQQQGLEADAVLRRTVMLQLEVPPHPPPAPPTNAVNGPAFRLLAHLGGCGAAEAATLPLAARHHQLHGTNGSVYLLLHPEVCSVEATSHDHSFFTNCDEVDTLSAGFLQQLLAWSRGASWVRRSLNAALQQRGDILLDALRAKHGVGDRIADWLGAVCTAVSAKSAAIIKVIHSQCPNSLTARQLAA